MEQYLKRIKESYLHVTGVYYEELIEILELIQKTKIKVHLTLDQCKFHMACFLFELEKVLYVEELCFVDCKLEEKDIDKVMNYVAHDTRLSYFEIKEGFHQYSFCLPCIDWTEKIRRVILNRKVFIEINIQTFLYDRLFIFEKELYHALYLHPKLINLDTSTLSNFFHIDYFEQDTFLETLVRENPMRTYHLFLLNANTSHTPNTSNTSPSPNSTTSTPSTSSTASTPSTHESKNISEKSPSIVRDFFDSPYFDIHLIPMVHSFLNLDKAMNFVV